ncbi:23S rRNA (guanosine(2251)-2'-O)-methyltransferase RlmB [Zymobacter palmae]|uniref:23S rRNA (guanosine-2'-O-)-methyltransferase RlmB n=1 Tax=Zymobacter palmae TaxID=33074 RepID=A0A348HGU4_9GAMM|nr:23S rRNA (guanosine(2251)-2'-O)-methyltransferase RlmB [Zymobacter palmae]BBG30846.1 rRNA methylases [Zymobacter palmae]
MVNKRNPSRTPAARERRRPAPKGAATRSARPAPAGPRLPNGVEPVYGVHSVEALLARPAASETIRTLWVQQGDAERRLHELMAQAQSVGIPVEFMVREQLDAAASGGNHQGIMALCPPIEPASEQTLWWRLDDWKAEQAPLFLVLDGVTDPHNLGACLRNADAAGAHGIIVPKDRSATLNATVRKVASGAAEAVPVYQVTNLARTLTTLQEKGVWVLGMAGEAESMLYDIDLTGPCALVMGAEGKGMRRLTRERCDQWAKLPMAGEVSSLNVSVAAGITLFEAVRQRR